MNADFYRAFEDRFRGSRQDILARLAAAYEPFVSALDETSHERAALDLGCGRGEWLEFLAAQGFVARGVDLDDGMLTDCHERGLSAEKADALEALKAQPDVSLTIVSGFHFIEHVMFGEVLEVMREAHRALEPGGLLILETPNPENLLVGTELFRLDPTHTQPLPRGLIAFAVEYVGFSRHCQIGLHIDESVAERTLSGVLGRVSHDYAIVAQKEGPAAVVAGLDHLFGLQFTGSLRATTTAYDALSLDRDERIVALGQRAKQADLRLTAIERDARETAERLQRDLNELRLNLIDAETRATLTKAALDEMWRSRSWRLTKPLRASASLARRIRSRRADAVASRADEDHLTVPLTLRGQQLFDQLSARLGETDER